MLKMVVILYYVVTGTSIVILDTTVVAAYKFVVLNGNIVIIAHIVEVHF